MPLPDLDAITKRREGRKQTFMMSPVAAVTQADSDIKDLVQEVKRLRDVLGWVEAQCPGKCKGVTGKALAGEPDNKLYVDAVWVVLVGDHIHCVVEGTKYDVHTMNEFLIDCKKMWGSQAFTAQLWGSKDEQVGEPRLVVEETWVGE